MKKPEKNPKKRSRNIPEAISQEVKVRDFFQCAWCGEPLTDRHHIEGFNLGGAHEAANLILLCPTHHRMAHNGQISSEELINRKSKPTHLKNDRIPGGFRTSLEKLKFKLGNNIMEDVRHIIAFEYQPILTVESENKNIYLSANFYDMNGNLIFWMRRNNYWAPSFYVVSSSLDELTIYDKENEKAILKIVKDGEHLAIECRTYLEKCSFEVSINKDVIFKSPTYNFTLSKGKLKDFHIGFWIADAQFTREEFLKLNNEQTDLMGDRIVIKPG